MQRNSIFMQFISLIGALNGSVKNATRGLEENLRVG